MIATLTATSGGENSAHDPECKAEPAAPVADNRRRRDRRRAWAGGKRERAAQGQIVEIVTSRLGERPVLPPAGHAAVDKPRIAPGAVGRTEAQALHHPGPVALDQCVGGLDEAERLFDRFRALEIEGDNPFPRRSGSG